MTIYTALDYKILRSVRSDKNSPTKGYTKGNGTTIKEIIDITGLSEGKVRTTVTKLVKDGFLNLGISQGRTRTYYITKEGIEELKSIYQVEFEGDEDKWIRIKLFA